MYCSSCGAEAVQGLNYCNRCGANLNPSTGLIQQAPAHPVKLTGPSVALGLTMVISLGIIFSCLISLAEKGMHPAAITWIAIISLITVFGITALFIRLWSKLLVPSARLVELQQQRPPQLQRPQPAPQLQAPETGPVARAPIASVTDHTTRTFEPAYRERAEREKGN